MVEKQISEVPPAPTEKCWRCGSTEYWWSPPLDSEFNKIPGVWLCKKCVKEPVDKTEVIDGYLNGRPVATIPKPTIPCSMCKRTSYYWRPAMILFDQLLSPGAWLCNVCGRKPEDYVEPVIMIDGVIQEEKPVDPEEEKARVKQERIEQLRQRIGKGIDTLTNYYNNFKLEHTEDINIDETFSNGLATLEGLCEELTILGYTDCLFIVDGKKTRKCLGIPDGAGGRRGCWVCPSEKPYWKDEETDEAFERLKSARRRIKHNLQGDQIIEFLKTLGGKI